MLKYLIIAISGLSTCAFANSVDTKAWKELQPTEQQPVFNDKLNTIKANQQINLTGYIADVAENGDFILVPYLTKCFHFPPAAYNQTILVKAIQGISKSSIERLVHVSGNINNIQTQISNWTVGYTLTADSIYITESIYTKHQH